jgi:hypothetical protein
MSVIISIHTECDKDGLRCTNLAPLTLLPQVARLDHLLVDRTMRCLGLVCRSPTTLLLVFVFIRLLAAS